MGTLQPFKYGIFNTTHNDIIAYNNNQSLIFNTCTSYDPNEKLVTPQGKTADGFITNEDSILTYTIRFQNTGNATAANIIVTDTISNKLDLMSMKVLVASHNYDIEIANNNLLKFKFLGIMLPDSNNNEPQSHGYITYQIKQKPNNAPYTVINNTANIYFDYNAPIITNTTVNTIYKKITPGTIAAFKNTSCTDTCGNGFAQITTANGVAPIIYSITPSCTNTIVNGNFIDHLSGNTYTIIATDALGETYSSTFVIANPTPMNITTSTTNVTSGNNGSITANVAGGVFPFTYTILPNNLSGNINTFNNLAVGTYTINIIDNGGCMASALVVVNYPTSINGVAKNNWLKFYPNPSNTILNIEANEILENIELYNSVGALVYKSNATGDNNATINVRNFAAGFYVLKVKGFAPQRVEIK
jgi:uncharacterized repeat protein (TIGR01451 family)